MFFCCFAAFLLLAPLYKAGNRPLPLLLLELAALGFLFAIFAVHRAPIVLPRTLQAAIGLLLLYPLRAAGSAAGRALAGPARARRVCSGARSIRGRRRRGSRGGRSRWSPSATEYGWLALLPPLACLLGRVAAVACACRATAAVAGDPRRRRGRAGVAAGRAERRRDALSSATRSRASTWRSAPSSIAITSRRCWR